MAIGLFDSAQSIQRPAALARSGADRFKTRENSVRGERKEPGERVHLKSCRCWSRVCQSCAPVLGRRVQRRLLDSGSVWEYPRLLTLTIDRKHFSSPQEAYKRVTEGRYLPRLMEALGIERWVRVLEFQMQTGDGWPHWHMIIDKKGRRGFVDYKKAWSLWRDVWGLGGVDVTNQKKMEGRPTSDIVRYLCKYMVKFPEQGFPSWVMDLSNVRFIQASRSVGALVYRSDLCKVDGGVSGCADVMQEDKCNRSGDGDAKRTRLFSRSLRDRVSGCGEVSSMFLESADGEKYFSRIPVRVGQVAIAAKRGLIEGVEFETQSDGYGRFFMGVVLTRFVGETLEEMAYRVEEGVRLLQHQEGTHINPPSYKQEGGCYSESLAAGCASVPETLAEWRRLLRKGLLYSSLLEAVEVALAETDDGYLLGLIEEEQGRSMPVGE